VNHTLDLTPATSSRSYVRPDMKNTYIQEFTSDQIVLDCDERIVLACLCEEGGALCVATSLGRLLIVGASGEVRATFAHYVNS
jgi:hypothetical protein